ncbi:MAG: DUF3880 domain-containing protein [Lachnospiraceae bacterium]
MKIIFYRYGSICEPDILEAFQACGISVIEETTEVHQKKIEAKDRIRLISELILTHQPMFVFSINFFPYISNICEKLDVLYVCLSVDCPVLELFSTAIRNRCNRIFLFDRIQYQRFCSENPDCIFYLPLAANVTRWDNVRSSLTEEDKLKYSCDISFVGSLYTEKSPMADLTLDKFHKGFADGLMEAQLSIMGYNFLEEALTPSLTKGLRMADPDFYRLPDAFTDTDSYVAANYYLGMQASALDRIRTLQAIGEDFSVNLYTRSDIADLRTVPGLCCRGGVSTHAEMPKVFYFSKINLNITMKPIQSGLSQRIWDVLGCRGFLLSNYQSEIPEYFTVGEDLDCYESLAELKNKIRYYLTHDDIRNSIAQSGYEKVKSRHTYIHRILQIMQVLFPQFT